jgi:hypothetical protein
MTEKQEEKSRDGVWILEDTDTKLGEAPWQWKERKLT